MRIPAEQRGRRLAFTLVELLVVISIIAILGGLGYLVGGVFLKTKKVVRAPSDIQATLFTAKQMALRDRIPTGVRLILSTAPAPSPLVTPVPHVVSLQYIQQPPDLNDGSISVAAAGNAQLNTVTFTNPSFLTGGLTNQALWPVQIGDFLQIRSGPLVQIAAITVGAPTATVVLVQPVTAEVGTTEYRIVRQPR